jgi:hypothetical protein
MLTSFIVKNILTEAQNGYREKKSTKAARQTFIERIQEAMDKGLHALGLYFDLTKAYDVFNHDILPDKHNSYGIRGKTNLWFKSYLTHSMKFVEINQIDHCNSIQDRYISSCMEVKYGVP